jgi:ferritin-like metal-binding protein YciE
MTVDEFYQGVGGPGYSEYYNQLKQDQQIAYRKYIESLLKRARSFKMNELRRRFERDGLSPGEKTHLSIIEKLFENRLETLSNSKRSIVEMLKGGKNA